MSRTSGKRDFFAVILGEANSIIEFDNGDPRNGQIVIELDKEDLGPAAGGQKRPKSFALVTKMPIRPGERDARS